MKGFGDLGHKEPLPLGEEGLPFLTTQDLCRLEGGIRPRLGCDGCSPTQLRHSLSRRPANQPGTHGPPTLSWAPCH